MTAVEAGGDLGTWQGLGELRLCGRMALIPLLFGGGRGRGVAGAKP